MDKGVGKNQKVRSGAFKTEIRVYTSPAGVGRITRVPMLTSSAQRLTPGTKGVYAARWNGYCVRCQNQAEFFWGRYLEQA